MINEDNISASDDAVTKRLKSWGLSAEVVQAFKDQKITEEVFPYLDKNTIDVLIPLIGERILFNLKYKAENSIILQEPAFNEVNQNINDNIIQHIPNNLEKIDNKYDLESILKKYDKGIIVLHEFKNNNKLNFRTRNYLSEIIINYELKDDLDKRLSPERLNLIANKIIELFPTEAKETYIDIDNTNKICITGKGKLYNKWYNKRRELAKLSLIPSGRKGKQKGLKRAREKIENNDAILWLKNSSQPWFKVLQNWQETSGQRRNELLINNISVGQYMAQYPALLNEKGLLL
ncbi:hypothetical protein PUN28_009771 [Cardiocondyla obscurior]|uniref:Uncharacterized protein n=1 Tax=Cardiocondyla obscurior TaxID=286306 RepID=A0AAW2FQI1_9HYME